MRILSYPTPAKQKPIPVWKHVVFVPLLLWVGAFVVIFIAALVRAGWALLSK